MQPRGQCGRCVNLVPEGLFERHLFIFGRSCPSSKSRDAEKRFDRWAALAGLLNFHAAQSRCAMIAPAHIADLIPAAPAWLRHGQKPARHPSSQSFGGIDHGTAGRFRHLTCPVQFRPKLRHDCAIDVGGRDRKEKSAVTAPLRVDSN